jgi:autotransporter-associated beta strand protein
MRTAPPQFFLTLKGIYIIRFCSSRLLAAALMSFLAATAAADERPGNLWDTVSQMSMPGLPAMKPQTMQLCTAKTWTQPPPPPAGQICTQTNVQRTDSKITWSVACTGEMDMTGDGEITFAGDNSYTGRILFNAGGMTMTVSLSGTKIDECDNPIS